MNDLKDVTGFRGEKIVELCLTEYSAFSSPLFRAGFLRDKWPAIDFYVELTDDTKGRLYFFAQAKSTTNAFTKKAKSLRISTDKDDVARLLAIPAPTYILGIHEPTKRVFARAIVASTPRKAITTIPMTHELNAKNLKVLHDEIVTFWSSAPVKPSTSVFT